MRSKKVLTFFILATFTTSSFPLYAETVINSPNLSSFYNDGDFHSAIGEYEKKADEGDNDAYLNEAIIYKDLADYAQAAKVLREALKRSEGDRGLSLFLGKVLYLDGKSEEAVPLFKKILEEDPDHFEANLYTGLCFQDLQNNKEARRFFEEAVKKDAESVWARAGLAETYLNTGKTKEAIAGYEQLKKLDPSSMVSYRNLPPLYEKEGRLEDSLEGYQKLLRMDPSDKTVLEKIRRVESRLGKKFRADEKEKRAVARKIKTILVPPSAFPEDPSKIRIGILQNTSLLDFKCSTSFKIYNSKGKELTTRAKEAWYSVTPQSGRALKMASVGKAVSSVDTVHDRLTIEPSTPGGVITIFNLKQGEGDYWSGQADRSFRGKLDIRLSDKGFTVVNIVSMEDYLYSVVPSEMPSSWPHEALKAQAIAARSEATYKLGRHAKDGFDLCSTTHCQVYSGVEQETAAVRKAVDETRGVLMLSDGKPVDAVYSSNCGGHTQDNIFGDEKKIPYLTGRADLIVEEGKRSEFLSPLELERWIKAPPEGIFCRVPKYSAGSSFRWMRSYSAKEMEQMAGKLGDLGEILSIRILKREMSGHLSSVEIVGTKGSQVIKKELLIRKAFGNLRSSLFQVEIKKDPQGHPEKFIFFGGGWGHGVGLCQSGAAGMAALGFDSPAILKHYYRGVSLTSENDRKN